jgi:predicted ATPase
VLQAFESLHLENWRQFSDVEIRFHPRLTVLTGANGSGKTTILNILSRHFGWTSQFMSTPRSGKGGALRYLVDVWPGRRDDSPGHEGWYEIGTLKYSSDGATPILVPRDASSAAYDVTMPSQQHVPGLYVTSHRPVYFYQRVDSIPTTVDPAQQLFEIYFQEIRSRYLGGHTGRSASSRIKEALISLATFGYGNQAVARNVDAVQVFEGFEQILRTVLPRTLRFRRLRIEMPEVVFDTGTGAFSFDAISGGVAAIVDLAWQIYMRSLNVDEFTVIVDEPENHLHPELQKELLPKFLRAFPQTQFVVATHNPFIVTSQRESHVYVLRYTQRGRVRSLLLDHATKAATANEILREVLGLAYTLPAWAAADLKTVGRRYASEPLSTVTMERLRADLEELGLQEFAPSVISDVLRRRK